MWQFLFALLLGGMSLFLILLVLVQRGRGGGLTGALGGMGGQSAFGTKAGDAFTKVTIISATVWILMAILSVKLLSKSKPLLGDPNKAVPVTTVTTGADASTLLNELQNGAGDMDAGATEGTDAVTEGDGAAATDGDASAEAAVSEAAESTPDP